MIVDFEFVPIEDAEQVLCNWEFEEQDQDFEAIEEMQENIALGEIFEELLSV